MALGDGLDASGNLLPGWVTNYNANTGVRSQSRRNMGREENPNYFSSDLIDNTTNPQALFAARKNLDQGNTGPFGYGMGGMQGMDAFQQMWQRIAGLEAMRNKMRGPPQPAGFGFDLPTMEMGGNVLGGIGKFMTGLGSLETAKYAGKSFDEKSKYNKLNWEQQLLKRAGEVSGENALRGDDNAYRTAQGIGHLADMIPV